MEYFSNQISKSLKQRKRVNTIWLRTDAKTSQKQPHNIPQKHRYIQILTIFDMFEEGPRHKKPPDCSKQNVHTPQFHTPGKTRRQNIFNIFKLGRRSQTRRMDDMGGQNQHSYIRFFRFPIVQFQLDSHVCISQARTCGPIQYLPKSVVNYSSMLGRPELMDSANGLGLFYSHYTTFFRADGLGQIVCENAFGMPALLTDGPANFNGLIGAAIFGKYLRVLRAFSGGRVRKCIAMMLHRENKLV